MPRRWDSWKGMRKLLRMRGRERVRFEINRERLWRYRRDRYRLRGCQGEEW